MVRALDILGAERRLSEYEALFLSIKLSDTEQNVQEWERPYGDRLPVYQRVSGITSSGFKNYRHFRISKIDRIFPSYRFNNYKNEIFSFLCRKGHLSVAQWLRSLGGLNFHVDNAFRVACVGGHLIIAQRLYSPAEVDIHMRDESAFRCCCWNGNLELAHWLGMMMHFDLHHLSIAVWLYSLGDFSIHAQNDEAFYIPLSFDTWSTASG
jgi:hypothetical protein